MKTHKGLAKRFKLSKPKKGRPKIMRQRKGMGSKHLKSKKSNPRKRRIRQTTSYKYSKSVKKAIQQLKQ